MAPPIEPSMLAMASPRPLEMRCPSCRVQGESPVPGSGDRTRESVAGPWDDLYRSCVRCGVCLVPQSLRRRRSSGPPTPNDGSDWTRAGRCLSHKCYVRAYDEDCVCSVDRPSPCSASGGYGGSREIAVSRPSGRCPDSQRSTFVQRGDFLQNFDLGQARHEERELGRTTWQSRIDSGELARL